MLNPIKLIIHIKSTTNSCIIGDASYLSEKVSFEYYLSTKRFNFNTQNELTTIINRFLFQFEKVILSASKRNMKVGQKINCVFIEDFHFLEESAYYYLIRLDRRNKDLKISTSQTETNQIHKLYTDGSYVSETMTSGYGGIIEDIDGKKEIYCESFLGGGSNKMELLAVLDGLKRLQSINKIQVITDSRYVIRGMIQWMHFWKHNDWQTAYGTQVKFAEYWKQMDNISNGKLIEFNWIKGHSGHTEQDLCHRLAKNSAQSI